MRSSSFGLPTVVLTAATLPVGVEVAPGAVLVAPRPPAMVAAAPGRDPIYEGVIARFLADGSRR